MTRLLMLLGVAILVIGVETRGQDQQARHEQAMAAIQKLGGDVKVGSKKPGAPVAVVLTGSASPGECVPHLKDLSNLHACDL